MDGSDVQVEVWEFVTSMGCTTSTAIETYTSSTAGIITVVSTSISTSVSTTTNSTALFGVTAVAVIFIITTGYLILTRGKKGPTL